MSSTTSDPTWSDDLSLSAESSRQVTLDAAPQPAEVSMAATHERSGKSRFGRAKQALDKQRTDGGRSETSFSGPSFAGFQPAESVAFDAPAATTTAPQTLRDPHFEAPAQSQPAPLQVPPTPLQVPPAQIPAAQVQVAAVHVPTVQAPTVQAPAFQAPAVQAPAVHVPPVQAPTVQVLPVPVQVPATHASPVQIPTVGAGAPAIASVEPLLTSAVLTTNDPGLPDLVVPVSSVPNLEIATPTTTIMAIAPELPEIAAIPDLPSPTLPTGVSLSGLSVARETAPPVLPEFVPTVAHDRGPSLTPVLPTDQSNIEKVGADASGAVTAPADLKATTPPNIGRPNIDGPNIDAVTAPPKATDVTMDELRAMLTGASDRFETVQKATWDPNEVARPSDIHSTFPPASLPNSFPPASLPNSFPPASLPNSFPPASLPNSFPPASLPNSFPPAAEPVVEAIGQTEYTDFASFRAAHVGSDTTNQSVPTEFPPSSVEATQPGNPFEIVPAFNESTSANYSGLDTPLPAPIPEGEVLDKAAAKTAKANEKAAAKAAAQAAKAEAKATSKSDKEPSTTVLKEKTAGFFGRKKPTATPIGAGGKASADDPLATIAAAVRAEQADYARQQQAAAFGGLPTQTSGAAQAAATGLADERVASKQHDRLGTVSLDEFDQVMHASSEKSAKPKKASKLGSLFAKQDKPSPALADTMTDRGTKLMRIASAVLLVFGLGLLGFLKYGRSDSSPTTPPVTTPVTTPGPLSIPIPGGQSDPNATTVPVTTPNAGSEVVGGSTESTPTSAASTTEDDFFSEGEDLAVK